VHHVVLILLHYAPSQRVVTVVPPLRTKQVKALGTQANAAKARLDPLRIKFDHC